MKPYVLRVGLYTFKCRPVSGGKVAWALKFKATPDSKSETMATNTAFAPWLAEAQANAVLQRAAGLSLPFSEYSQAGV